VIVALSMCICHIHLALIKLYVDMLLKVIQFFHATKKFLYRVFYNNLFSPPGYMKERSSIVVIEWNYVAGCAR
jgi:hypothetical protein